MQTISDGIGINRRHYFFGNNENTTQQMIEELKKMFPNIQISGYICPEQMTAEELALKYKKDFQSINADIVWVSLGFPKQEQFIEKNLQSSR